MLSGFMGFASISGLFVATETGKVNIYQRLRVIEFGLLIKTLNGPCVL